MFGVKVMCHSELGDYNLNLLDHTWYILIWSSFGFNPQGNTRTYKEMMYFKLTVFYL